MAQPLVIMSNYGDMGGNKGMAEMFTYAIMHPSVIAVRLFRQNNIVAMLSMLLPFFSRCCVRGFYLAESLFLLKMPFQLQESSCWLITKLFFSRS